MSRCRERQRVSLLDAETMIAIGIVWIILVGTPIFERDRVTFAQAVDFLLRWGGLK